MMKVSEDDPINSPVPLGGWGATASIGVLVPPGPPGPSVLPHNATPSADCSDRDETLGTGGSMFPCLAAVNSNGISNAQCPVLSGQWPVASGQCSLCDTDHRDPPQMRCRWAHQPAGPMSPPEMLWQTLTPADGCH